MEGPGEQRFDLSAAKATAFEVAREWGLHLGEPFGLSYVSYVAPAGNVVLKVAWEGDTESVHEGDALELWDGSGAVRLLRRSGRAILEERAVPGDDISLLPDDEATEIAVNLASRLWRRAGSPFRTCRRLSTRSFMANSPNVPGMHRSISRAGPFQLCDR